MSKNVIIPIAQIIKERTTIPFRNDEFSEVVSSHFMSRPGDNLRIKFTSTNIITEFPSHNTIEVPVSWMTDVRQFLFHNGLNYQSCHNIYECQPYEIFVSLYETSN